MKRATTPICIAAAMGLMLGMGGTPAVAGQQFTEQEIESFAVAVIEIEQINQVVQQEMQAADTPEEQQQVQEQATAQMIEAIEAEGMTVDDYNEIATAVQTDPELAGQIEERILEAQ